MISIGCMVRTKFCTQIFFTRRVLVLWWQTSDGNLTEKSNDKCQINKLWLVLQMAALAISYFCIVKNHMHSIWPKDLRVNGSIWFKSLWSHFFISKSKYFQIWKFRLSKLGYKTQDKFFFQSKLIHWRSFSIFHFFHQILTGGFS